MKVIQMFVVGFITLTLLNSCRKDERSDEIYDVILIIGQSNNYYGDDLDQLKPLEISENIKQLGRFDDHNYQIIPATENLEHHTYESNKGGYALTFAKLYESKKLEENHKILLVPCAKFGSSFIEHNWNKGDKYYNDAIERTSYVLVKYPKSQLACILWHQGESDVNNVDYESNLDAFVKNLRTDLNAKNTPFILGGMVPFWAKQNSDRIKIQNIIKNTPNRLEKTAYADPNFPFLIEKSNNSKDSIHYSAKGLRELGQRYFYEFLGVK